VSTPHRSFPDHRRSPTLAGALRWVLIPVVFLACDDSVSPGPDPVDGPRNEILFISTLQGSVNEFGRTLSDIFDINADGTARRRLTAHSNDYYFLSLSPDRSRLAFYANEGGVGCFNVRVSDVEVREVTQVTGLAPDERCNVSPYWSPDGHRIGFTSSRNPDFGWDAYVMNPDGTGVVNVSRNPSVDLATSHDRVVGWTPDGRIVVHTNREGREGTYLMSADGSQDEPFMADNVFLYPRWSPDGTRIVATSDRDGNWEVYVITADRSEVMNVTLDPEYDHIPLGSRTPWSPDGSRIAFQSTRSGNTDVFVVSPDGSGIVNVSNDPGRDMFMDWSPDGSRILFASDRYGDTELFIADADGTHLVSLTRIPSETSWPYAIWVSGR